MPSMIYPNHHRDDEVLNDFLANLRLNDSPPRLPQPLPFVPPRSVTITAPSLHKASAPIPSGSGIANRPRAASHSAHAPFGWPVDPPRPIDSPPPSPDFDQADIEFWDDDPDISPFGPSERTYNVTVGSETGIISTWYVSHYHTYLTFSHFC